MGPGDSQMFAMPTSFYEQPVVKAPKSIPLDVASWHPDTPEFREMVAEEERILAALDAASHGPTHSLDDVVAELGIDEDGI